MNREELLKKLAEYSGLRRELAVLLSEKTELEEAKRLIEKSTPRRIYRFLGPLAVEITMDEAKQYLDERLEILELRIKKIEELMKALREELKGKIPAIVS